MILRVTQYGEPILKKKTTPVTDFNQELESFAKDMIETMYNEEGIGLAAPQVDSPLSICVVDVSPSLEISPSEAILDEKITPAQFLMPLTLVNPTFKAVDKELVPYEEGCLSIPGVNGEVSRPDKILVEYQDLQGNSHSLECNGILSRCIQHEIDHLNGILFTDYLSNRELLKVQTKLKKLKRQSRDFLKHK